MLHNGQHGSNGFSRVRFLHILGTQSYVCLTDRCFDVALLAVFKVTVVG